MILKKISILILIGLCYLFAENKTKRITFEHTQGKSPFQYASLGKMVWFPDYNDYLAIGKGNYLNSIVKNKKDTNDKYLFLTNNGRWDGFIDEKILKSISIKKWDRTIVADFKKPINKFASIYINTELWKTIEKIEKTKDGKLLVINSPNIPLGIIDRNKVGYFVLHKLGLNLPPNFLNKFNNKNNYPLGIELPRIIKLMKKKGDIE